MAETRKKNNAIAIDADAKNKSNRAMLLYEQLKKDLSVEGPSVFSAVLFLTCDILSNIPLKNISKETIDQRITFLGTKGAKFSNTVRQNVTQQLLEQLNLTRRPKEEVVKQILFLARYDDALLMEDFNQYKREICRRLDVSKQKLFKTICDMSCVLIRSDTEQLLFKNPEQRILDVEKNLHFKM